MDCEEAGDAGGEAASLREAPLPQTPSPEERLAFEGLDACGGGSACEVGRFPCGLRESTAADRAAADMRRWGTGGVSGLFLGFPLPKSIWRLRGLMLAEVVPPAKWAGFL